MPDFQYTGSDSAGSAYDTVLKDFYEGPIREHINNNTKILKQVEKSKRKWSGRQVLFPVHLRRNTGVGARTESGSLPVAGRQTYVDSKIKAKYMYGRITLTGAVIAASRGDKGAFASALRTEVDGMRSDLRDDMNRQCFGNNVKIAPVQPGDDVNLTGISGVLGIVSAVDGTNITVTNTGTRFLKQGMSVQGGTHDELVAGNHQTTTVSSVTNTSTFVKSGAGTLQVHDVLVRGDSSDHSFGSEITGIDVIVDNSGELQGINSDANSEWKSSVLENTAGNRPLSLELMQLAVDSCDEVGGTEPNYIIGHHSMRREYINLLTSDVRYSAESLKGGQTVLTFSGGSNPIKIEFDKHAPYNKLFFLRTSDLRLYVQQDWKWADRDGATFARVSGSDAWEAFMCFYGNLGCERRNTHAVLTDISASNLIF